MGYDFRHVIKFSIAIALVVASGGCQNYVVDASSSKQFSSMINRCFVTTKELRIVRHEKDRGIVELSPGNSGPGLIQMGAIDQGTKIILRRVERKHIVSYGDLYYGNVEFQFQGESITAEVFSIFLTDRGFAPNPNWLVSCD